MKSSQLLWSHEGSKESSLETRSFFDRYLPIEEKISHSVTSLPAGRQVCLCGGIFLFRLDLQIFHFLAESVSIDSQKLSSGYLDVVHSLES